MNRYARQKLFGPIGEKGQVQLANSSVLIVGAGALGGVIANQLARAGVGKIRLIDRDFVEMSNLQRQFLFDEQDVKDSLPKAIAAKNKLEASNSDIQVEAIVGNVTNDNINELIQGIDVVLDGTDNFSTRYLLNDICFKKGIPYSYGGVVSSRGMTAFFIPQQTPCLRCLVKEGSGDGQTCDTIGIISPIVDIISSYQVTETIKYLTGNIKSLRHTLKTIDLWSNQQLDMKLNQPKKDCPTCQESIYPALQKTGQDNETILCGRNTVQIHRKSKMDLEKWAQHLRPIAKVKRTPFLLKAQMDEDIDFVIFTDGRVLVQGTEDAVKARTLYDRYIGS